MRFLSRLPLGEVGSLFAPIVEIPFAVVFAWPATKYGNKLVSERMFSSRTVVRQPNSWRIPLRRCPVTWIASVRPNPLGNTHS
jgi:hypothetical protein